MPTFYINDLEIEPADYIDNCSYNERDELITLLAKDGYVLLPDRNIIGSQLENDHMDRCIVLGKKFYSMSNEDLETFEKLYNKYR